MKKIVLLCACALVFSGCQTASDKASGPVHVPTDDPALAPPSAWNPPTGK